MVEPARAIELCLPICAGLAAAHAAGVVHGDLKPDNVLVTPAGRVVITDFGIARCIQGMGESLPAGTPIGTPAYMAPEQVRGEAIDPRTDLYALGVMLFEMVVGQRPWRAKTPLLVATLRLLHPPPDPSQLRPELPPQLSQLVRELLSRDPADRPASVEQAAERLRAIATAAERCDGPAPVSAPARPPAAPRQVAPPSPSSSSAPSLRTGEIHLAVLPFRNAGLPEHEHWAASFADDLIETLSLVPRLRVRSSGAIRYLRESKKPFPEDPCELGRAVGVDVVVEGSVRRHGSLVRVQVRAVSVADGFQLFARRLECSDAEVLSLADDAASHVAGALLEPLAPRARRPITDVVALDLYLRARHEHHRLAAGSAAQAARLLEEALTRLPDEPLFLAAHSLARSRVWLLATTVETPSCLAAEASARRAIALAPELGESHLALAGILMQQGQMEEGIDALRRALTCSPLLAEAHENRGRLLLELGAPDEGKAALERAAAIEPQMAGPRRELARAHAFEGDFAAAGQILEPLRGSASGAVPRARLLLWQGDVPGAQAVFDAFPDGIVQLARGVMFEGRGLRDDAGEVGGAHVGTQPQPQPPRRIRRELYYLQLRIEALAAGQRTAEATELLQEAVALGLFDVTWCDRCPALDSLRADRRFQALSGHVAVRAKTLLQRLTAGNGGE
jgi:serine/threonine-protein kinase